MEGLSLLPAMVALPLGGAFVVTLAGRRVHGVGPAVTLAVLVALLVSSVALFGSSAVYSVGGWPTPVGIDLRLDPLAALVMSMIAGVGLAACVHSIGSIGRDSAGGRYFALVLLLTAAMNGVASAGDLFNLYVFVEIASMAAYALIAYGGRAEDFEASFKYAVLGSIASTLILLGIGTLFAVTGTLNMAHLADRLADPGIARDQATMVNFAIALLLAGFGFKAALVPFHAWLLDAYPAAPSPISALLAGAMSKVLGVYVLARLFFNVLPPNDDALALLRILGVASMVVGALGALGQRELKRLFAYSSVEQSGYLILAVGLGTPLGALAAVFHMVNHAAFKTLLFLDAGTVERATGTTRLSELGGLARTMPGTCATTLIGALSNAGLPPFGGFWSKLLIVIACVHAGAPELAIVTVLVSVITLAFQLTVLQRVFFSSAPEAPTVVERPRSVPWTMRAPAWALALVCATLGLACVTGLTRPALIAPAADALTDGSFTVEAARRTAFPERQVGR